MTAEAVLNANDPDSRFKAEMAVRIMDMTETLNMTISYINKPVSHEGILNENADGNITLDTFPISE